MLKDLTIDPQLPSIFVIPFSLYFHSSAILLFSSFSSAKWILIFTESKLPQSFLVKRLYPYPYLGISPETLPGRTMAGTGRRLSSSPGILWREQTTYESLKTSRRECFVKIWKMKLGVPNTWFRTTSCTCFYTWGWTTYFSSFEVRFLGVCDLGLMSDAAAWIRLYSRAMRFLRSRSFNRVLYLSTCTNLTAAFKRKKTSY